MWRFLRLGWKLLPRRKRWWWVALVPLLMIAAAAESAGAGGVFLLIGVLSDPKKAPELPVAAELHRALPGPPEQSALVLWMTGLLALFYLVKNAFLALVVYLENRLFHRTTAELSQDLLARYLKAPYAFHLKQSSAELIHRVTEGAYRVVNLVLGATVLALSEALVVLGILAVMIAAAPFVTLVTVGGLASVIGVLVFFTQKRFYGLGEREIELRKKALRAVQQTFEGLKEIRVFHREDYYRRLFAGFQAEIAKTVTLLRFLEQLPRLTVESVFIAATLLVVVLITSRGQEALDVVPVLGLYAYAGFRVIPSFNRLMLRMNNFWYGSPSVDDLCRDVEALEAQTRRLETSRMETGRVGTGGAETRLDGAHEKSGAAAVEGAGLDFGERIDFDRVSYAYNEDPILEEISLTIPRGGSVGLVGATGAGKSTLVDLLLGLLEPSAGAVRVDGADIRTDLAAWRRRIGYVPQTLFLVDDTLRRNIAFALEEAEVDDEKVRTAVRLAGLGAFLEALPEGLETTVGERGIRLSGGQRQRLAIARALYHDPEILIFDEATSALDGQAERELSETLQALHGEKTLVVVAHRLTTIESCEHLFFLRGGRVAGDGSYQKLVRESVLFRETVGLS